MSLFGSRKEKILDLSENYRDEDESRDSKKEGGFSGSAEERKRKLAKRILDMSNKIEELSSQVYKIQQRIELIEKKVNFHSD